MLVSYLKHHAIQTPKATIPFSHQDQPSYYTPEATVLFFHQEHQVISTQQDQLWYSPNGCTTLFTHQKQLCSSHIVSNMLLKHQEKLCSSVTKGTTQFTHQDKLCSPYFWRTCTLFSHWGQLCILLTIALLTSEQWHSHIALFSYRDRDDLLSRSSAPISLQ